MKFVVDECVGPSVARWLSENNYDVFSVYDQARGADDSFVLQKAITEDRILITNDKDFGDMIFRDKREHKGIILFRLSCDSVTNKIEKLKLLLENYSEKLYGNFVVVTEKAVRIVE